MTIICIEFCELFVLTRESLEEVLFHYPEYEFVVEEKTSGKCMQPKLQVQQPANPADATEKRRRSLSNDVLHDFMGHVATAIPEEAGDDDDDNDNDNEEEGDGYSDEKKHVGEDGKASLGQHAATTAASTLENETCAGPSSSSSSAKRKSTLSKHDNERAGHSAIRVQHSASVKLPLP